MGLALQLLRRLAAVPLVVFVVATITFVVLRVVPGSAVDQLAGAYGTPQQRAETRSALGLDDSVFEQYATYLSGLVQLDFGRSFFSGRAVGEVLAETVPVTIELAIAAGLLMVVVGVVSGVVAAALRGTWADTAIRGVAAVLFSVPWFFAGVLLLIVFTQVWPILPSFGRLPPTITYEPKTHFVLIDAIVQGRPELVGPWLERLILPALTVGLTTAGFVTRITRASVLETTGQDHVRTAIAKGMSPWRMYRRHVLPNAALPVMSVVGLQFGALLGGAVVAEVVFSYPGVGKLLVDTVFRRDYPVVQGAALVIATAYVLVNVLTETSYTLLDPRLRAR